MKKSARRRPPRERLSRAEHIVLKLRESGMSYKDIEALADAHDLCEGRPLWLVYRWAKHAIRKRIQYERRHWQGRSAGPPKDITQ